MLSIQVHRYNGIYLSTASRLHRLPGIDPGLEAAKEGCHFLITVLQKEERRTGARVFIRSGTVGDDPLVLVQLQAGWIGFDVKQGNGQGAGDMAGLIGLSVAYIQDDRFAALNGRRGFLHRYARDICIRLRKSIRGRY